MAMFGYALVQIGQLWLLSLVARECEPHVILMALVIPLFTMCFALMRWEIAKWAFLLNLTGILFIWFGR